MHFYLFSRLFIDRKSVCLLRANVSRKKYKLSSEKLRKHLISEFYKRKKYLLKNFGFKIKNEI